MDLLAGAGFTDYRFSVEWARIEPAPGEFSAAALAHYRRMIEGARTRGLRPLVTLHHFTNPRWFDAAGGWTGANAAPWFARYVDAATRILEGVDHICTINEPNMIALMAGTAVGGEPQVAQLEALTPNRVVSDALIDAHRKAASVLHAKRPEAKVGWSIACLNAYTDNDADGVVADFAYPRETVFAEVSRDDDWVGVQAYTRTRLARSVDQVVVLPARVEAERTLTGWEYYPAAVGEAIRSTAAVAVGVPVIVTENGIATTDDKRRIDYTTGALQSLWAAVDAGVDVQGYFHWSLLDSYEWGTYTPTFGLVAVDRQTFERNAKPSLRWLGSMSPVSSTGTPEEGVA